MADITRYDRNLANNMLDFSYYEEDAVLIKNLVAFFSFDIHHNILPLDLFGKRILDPVVFAEHMGYKNYRSLIKKHPTPAQFKGMDQKRIEAHKAEVVEQGEPTWETLLCNAIYRMKYEPLRFTKPGKTPDGLNTSELRELRFLKFAKKFHDPARKKIFYEIEYDDTHMNNLARFFMKYSNQVYAQLRKADLQDLYIYLINLRDLANKDDQPEFSIDTVSFDYLCTKAGTNCKEPKEKKKYLNNAFKKINALIGEEVFSLGWKKNGRHYYHPVLTFRYTEKELQEKTRESTSRFNLFFKRNIIKEFARKYIKSADDINDNFLKARKWLTDHEQDVVLKRSVYADTHIQCFGREVDIYTDQTNEKLRNLCNNVSEELLGEANEYTS